MNIPNLISLARLLSVPILVWAIVDGRMGLAFWLFAVAGLSDAVDGFIAKRFGSQSVVGGYLDPLADKALLMSVYITLGSEGYLPNWIVILVVSRDVMIIGGVLLYHTLTHNLAMTPILISKINTLAQILLAAFTLGSYAMEVEINIAYIALVWLVAVTTILSGASYLVRWVRKAATMEDAP
ncbi:MAG TPA: CDP-alcohol phosphatidyltransferase family protein [Alphaproteobacteria bacterium]|jgi:cardiolipin synthase